MKTLLITVAFFLTALFAHAGNNDRIVKDTVINKVSYHLYEGSKGGKYIIRTSKTGTTYKQYFKHS